MTHFQY